MDRPAIVDVALDFADRQHGVVSRRQLLASGVPARTIDARLDRQYMFPLFAGVYVVGRSWIGREGLWMGGVLAGGDRAVLGYQSAAAAWGILDFRPSVVVIRPHHSGSARGSQRATLNLRGKKRSVSLIVRRTRSLPESDRAAVNGIPVTSVARALLDLSSNQPPAVVKRAFLEADRLGLLTDAEIASCAGRTRGRAGGSEFKCLVRERLPESKPTKSVLEELFRSLCHERGIDPPETNLPVAGFEADCVWPARKLIVELDGFGYHRGRETFERDAARDNHHRSEGWTVLRFTWRMVTTEPDLVVNQVRTSLGYG